MRKVILDTDILSEYLKGHDEAVTRHAAAYLRVHPVFTFSSVTAYEIAYGLGVKNAESQLRKAMEWLRRNEEMTPTSADYLSAASIKSSAKKLGLIVELPDCLIASIALRLDLPLVTGNTADYESMRKTGVPLVLQNWRDALAGPA